MAKEQEIKFMMESPERALHLLLEAGALARNERTFEDNLVLDDASKTLARRGILLRLRKYGGKATLTMKSNAEVRDGLKVREEREVGVGDFEDMLGILAALGFTPVFRYQKYRWNFALEGAVASLDETPVGTYLEIEGEPQVVGAAAAKLGLEMSRGLMQSYMDLFRAFHPKGDMVFQ
jgi:adenylate cyclase class 2